MKYLKERFNWEAFSFVLILGAIGALDNKSAPTLLDCLFIVLIFGLPLAILFGVMGQKDKNEKL